MGVTPEWRPPGGGAPAEAPHDGAVIDGRYRLIRTLGVGGHGEVWEAIHTNLEKRCAIKFLRPRDGGGDEAMRRLHNEGRALARLKHPNIVEVSDSGEWAGRPYIVMDFIAGEPLRRRLEEWKRAGQPPPLDLVQRLVSQLCAGVAAAHGAEGGAIVHRDLKPENVMLHAGADGIEQATIIDFGVAQIADLRLTQPGSRMGTWEYMAPEQWLARGDAVGPPADVFALAVMLVELLTLKSVPDDDGPPWGQWAARGERKVYARLVQMGLGAMPALARVLARALASRPEARFADAGELGAALAAAWPGEEAEEEPAARGGGGVKLGIAFVIVIGVGYLGYRAIDIDEKPAPPRAKAARPATPDAPRPALAPVPRTDGGIPTVRAQEANPDDREENQRLAELGRHSLFRQRRREGFALLVRTADPGDGKGVLRAGAETPAEVDQVEVRCNGKATAVVRRGCRSGPPEQSYLAVRYANEGGACWIQSRLTVADLTARGLTRLGVHLAAGGDAWQIPGFRVQVDDREPVFHRFPAAPTPVQPSANPASAMIGSLFGAPPSGSAVTITIDLQGGGSRGEVFLGLFGVKVPRCRRALYWYSRYWGIEGLQPSLSPKTRFCYAEKNGISLCTPTAESNIELIRLQLQSDPENPELTAEMGARLQAEKRAAESQRYLQLADQLHRRRWEKMKRARAEVRAALGEIGQGRAEGYVGMLSALDTSPLPCAEYHDILRQLPPGAPAQVLARVSELAALLCDAKQSAPKAR